MLIIFVFSLLSLLFQLCYSTTILVDGVTQWNNPNVHVGDSIIFKHKYNYNLYIFQNQNAFNLCNFTQATRLTKPNSTSYTWHPSRPGFFYFTFNNGSFKSCQDSQKLSIKVSSSTSQPPNASPLPELPPMAAPGGGRGSGPISSGGGGGISSSPSYPWPFQPHQEASSPGPAPIASASSPMIVPPLLPEKGGGGIPFINSNPAVPLPTGEVDSATIRPLPTSAHGRQVVVGIFAGQMVLFCAVFLML